MTTVGEISVKISADLAPLRKAQADAKKIMGEIDSALTQSAQTVGAAFGSTWGAQVSQFSAGATQISNNAQKVGERLRQATEPANNYAMNIRDAGQFSQQAAFQFNDLAIQLASGQSAFVAITQQGAQLAQMFEPGTGLGAAARSLGAAFTQFLTNPLNLAVVAIAGVAAAVPMIWDAVNGSEAQDSQQVLRNFEELIERIGRTSEETQQKIEEMLSTPETWAALRANIADVEDELSDNLTTAMQNFNAEVTKMVTEIGIGFQGTIPVFSEAQQKIRDLDADLQSGRKSAEEVYEELNQMRTAETTPPSLITTINQLRAIIEGAVAAKSRLDALSGALGKTSRVSGPAQAEDRAANFGTAVDFEARFGNQEVEGLAVALREQRQSIVDDLAAIDSALRGGDTPKAKKSGGGGGERDRDFVESLRIETEYLQKQLDLMGLSYDERVRQQAQLNEEKAIREAIVRLGEKATPEQIAAIKELIPLQQQLNSEIAKQKAVQDTLNDAYVSAAGDIGSAIAGAIKGTEDLGQAFVKVALRIAEAVIQAQILQTFTGADGKMSQGGSIISSLVKGIFGGFFAEGGEPPMGKVSVVGEKGPELFVPKSSGVIIPNNQLRPGVGGGGSTQVEIMLTAQTDSSVIMEVADTQIKSRAPAIVKASVQQSQKQTQQNMPGYLANAQARSL